MAKHILRRLDESGDTVLATWDPEIEAEVESAFTEFDKQVPGFMAFGVTEDKQQVKVLERFEAEWDQVVLAHPLVGG